MSEIGDRVSGVGVMQDYIQHTFNLAPPYGQAADFNIESVSPRDTQIWDGGKPLDMNGKAGCTTVQTADQGLTEEATDD